MSRLDLQSSPQDNILNNGLGALLPREASVTASSTSVSPRYLMWFRRDLRLHDNTALAAICELAHKNKAQQNNAQVTALFILTPEQWLEQDMSLVQFDLICRTLAKLATALYEQLHIKLEVITSATFASSIDAVTHLCKAQNITHVAANIEYEVNELWRDDEVSAKLAAIDIEFSRYHDQCILPPNSVTTGDGSMYQVFTPFYKKWQSLLETSPPQCHESQPWDDNLSLNNQLDNQLANPSLTAILTSIDQLTGQALKDFQILVADSYADNDTSTDYLALLNQTRIDYPAGEVAARHRLDQFIAEDIGDYDVSRDRPALEATSRLSAYLTIGSISPRLCYLQAQKALKAVTALKDINEVMEITNAFGGAADIQRWISELAWRDFYRHVIAARPDIVRHQAYKRATDQKINWSYDESAFKRWCEGRTGVPLIDAAMRCLNLTGFMHNRLRMVTAMFLTKDLLIDWRWGERYFMQHLIDGDFASNNGGWQWSASVGTDAAPYFRIMNPFSQGKTHDKDAIFIKTWLPELKDIPAPILHDEAKLRKALVKGGSYEHIDYPLPMVDHKAARLSAIAEFKGD